MSKTVDERVVSMQFDNAQFQRNVQDTIGTIDQLKQQLKLLDSVKGFENISKSANNVDMSTLSNSVDNVGIKFNAMHTIADHALRRITDSAMSAGKKIVSALTIDPVKMGFSEYETQIGAIQTVLANTEKKGTTLEDVNEALDELNVYADKTIYNFTEMTRNIGTFTAAGIDLDTSVAAIKGIANLAAVSGSTSQQASTAMYQLSQALSSGTVRLMDWNSVVNAGMGGQVFQDALKETAKVHGIAIDDIIEKQGSFRESLSEGWLSSEILTETLAKFTGDLSEEQLKSMGYTEEQVKEIIKLGKTANDAATKVKTFSQLMSTLKEAAQSGWTQTWEIIVGDFEEAKEMWTKVSDTIGGMIGSAAEARNELLENWKVLGGRDSLIQSVVNIFEALKSLIAPISKAFREIFPPITAERLVEITEGFRKFTERLKLSDKASENLKRTFKGVFAILDIAKTILGAVFKAVGKLLKPFGGLCGALLEVTAYIGDLVVSFSDLIKNSNIFNAIFETIGSVIGFVVDLVTGFIQLIARKFVCPGFETLRDMLSIAGEYMGDVGQKAEDMRDSFTNALSEMGAALRDSAIIRFFENVWNGIKKVASAIGGFFSKAFGKAGTAVKNAADNFTVSGLLDFLIHLARVAQEFLKVGIGAKLYTMFGSLADGSKIFKSFKDIGKSIKGVFDGLTGCLAAMQANIKSGIIMRIAKALAVLALSVIALSLVDPERLTFAVSAVTIMLLELVIALRSVTSVLEGFGKDSGKTTKDLFMATKSISKIAGALILLAIAIKIMGSMSWKEMSVGLITMTVGLAAMVAALKVLSKIKFDPESIRKAAKAIKQVAWAMIPFAIAVKIMGTMSWTEMGVGLITMAAGLTIMTTAIKVLNSGKALDPKGTTKAATAMRKMAVAMLIFSAAIKIMGTMSWKEMGVGLITMTVGLAAMVAAIKVLNSGKLQPIKLMLAATAIQQISIAMVALAAAIKLMGMLSWKEMAVGLTGMVVGLAAITAALKLLPTTSAIKALGLVIVASSMMLLASAITAISLLPMQSVAKGLLIVAASFVVIGAAGYILAPIAGTLIKVAAAFAIFSVGVLALGAGLTAIGVGLIAIVTAFLYMSGSLEVIAKSLMRVIEAAIVGFITAIGAGILVLCEIIIKGAGKIAEAFVALITALCQAITKSVPVITKSVIEMTLGILEGLLSVAPKLIDMLFDLVIKVIDGLAKRLPELIASVMNLLGALFKGIIDAMNQMDPQILIKGILGVQFIKMFMKTLASIASLGLAAMKGVLILGVVIAELSLVLAAVGAIAQIPGLDWLINEGGKLLHSIGTAIGSFIGGIMGGIARGATATLPDVAVNLSNFMKNLKPFIDGVSIIEPSVLTSIKTLVSAIVLLTGANLINSITSFMTGGSSIASFGKELSMLGSGLKGFSDAAGDIVPDNITAAANAAKTLTEMCASIPNSGGMIAWFTGENSIAAFSGELIMLGYGLKGFSEAAGDINPDAIEAAATAAKTLTEMTASIPDSGGVVSWFAGDNSIANFASDLTLLGVGLKGFSDSVAGVNPDNIAAASTAAQVLTEMCGSIPNSGGVASWFAGDNSVAQFAEEIIKLGVGLAGFSLVTAGIVPENVSAASDAAKSLAEMASTIPNSGGVASWFAGDNSIAAFASELPQLGMGLREFSNSVTGIVPENVIAAATAAKALAEMANTIPNSGGVASWFAGDNSIAQFAGEISQLGAGLKGFSDSVININPVAVTAAANSAKAIAEMTNAIPNSGGVGSWFAGDNSLAQFSNEIVLLGEGLKGFSDNTNGINAETVSAAANAAKSLAELTQYIPNSGGVASWFAGEVSLSKFSTDIALLGEGLKGFSDNTNGINPEAVSAAANAAKSLAEMTQYIPNTGGIGAWFSGEVSLSKFSTDIALLGEGLKGFSDETNGIVAENVVAAAQAAKALAEMTQYIPNSGGVTAWFTGEASISNFAGHLPKLGEGLKGFSESIDGINPENLTAASKAAKSIAEMTGNTLTNVDQIPTLANSLGALGKGMKQCFIQVAGISKDSIARSADVISAIKNMGDLNISSIKSVATTIESLTKSVSNLSKVPKDAASGFNQAMKDLGNTSTDSLLKEFEVLETDMKNVGGATLDSFILGFESRMSAANNTAKNVANSAAEAIRDSRATFVSAGEDLVDGFASGISANSYKAAAKARAMAQAAAQAAKEELDINSPSKVFREIGYSIPEGLAAGIDKMGSLATDSAETMADDSIKNVKDTLYRISDVINGDMDMQPTIRPVLDLSDVRSGANSINGLFGRRSSVGVMANVNAINNSMNRRGQNGENEQVVSELTKLRKELAGSDRATYNINGLTFTGGSEVEEAFETILRAAKMGGRM